MRLAAILAAAALAASASAQDAAKEIQRYREMIAEGSPAELFEIDGEAMWKKPQGPKNVSLERCDLGEGPGVLKGAYAHLPRYFADADRVMDLETRLVWCMALSSLRIFCSIRPYHPRRRRATPMCLSRVLGWCICWKCAASSSSSFPLPIRRLIS